MMHFYNPNNRNPSRKQKSSLNKWNHLLRPITRIKQNNANITAIAGNWIEAVGAVVAAIGSTPSTMFTEKTLTDFNIIGNVI